MSWEEIQIKDIGKVITGNTPPKNDSENYGGNYPFLKPTDMNIGERYTFVTDEFYSEKAFEKYKKSYIPPLSTCVVTIGTIGEKMCLTHDWCFTNQSVNSVIPIQEKYDGMFVFYLLKYNLYQVKNANAGTSSGREHVNKTTFSNLKVSVPKSLETQKRIASILSTYDDLLENNLKRIKLLEETAQNIYKEWFVNFRFSNYEHTEFDAESGLPVGWEKINLYDFAEIKMGFSFKAEDFNEDNIGKPAIRIRDIPSSWTRTYTTQEVSEEFMVEQGDILIGMDGFFYLDIWRGQKGYLVQRVCRLRAKNESLQGFLLESLRQPISYYEKTISGATVAHLGAKHLKEIFINVPKDNQLLEDMKIFNRLNSKKINLSNQNQKLKEARDIMLPRLMNRTIEV